MYDAYFVKRSYGGRTMSGKKIIAIVSVHTGSDRVPRKELRCEGSTHAQIRSAFVNGTDYLTTGISEMAS